MHCAYELADGPCGSPIVEDGDSYSGYSHSLGRGWLHWATPKKKKIFKLCVICGQTGPANKAHILHSGHRFEAE